MTEATSKLNTIGNTGRQDNLISDLRAELQQVKSSQGDKGREVAEYKHEITELRIKLEAKTKD